MPSSARPGRHVLRSFPTRRSSDLWLCTLRVSASTSGESGTTSGSSSNSPIRYGSSVPGSRSRTRCSPWTRMRSVPSGTLISLCTTDRKSTRLNSSHLVISYAVFCSPRPPRPTLLPYTTLFRSLALHVARERLDLRRVGDDVRQLLELADQVRLVGAGLAQPHPLQPLDEDAQRTVGHLDQLVHDRSEEHTSELQSPCNLVCRLLLAPAATSYAPSLHDALPISGFARCA